MPTKFVTLTSYKGGVGKTTSAVCLSCLFSRHGTTLLIDSDSNRSALVWARFEQLPFQVVTDTAATRLMSRQKFDFVVIDTPARPTEPELQELATGCDLLIIPTTPTTLSLSAMGLMVKSLPAETPYQVLITQIPPAPQRDGLTALQEIQKQGFPVLHEVDRRDAFIGIRYFKAYEHAAASGVSVDKVRGGKIAWRDWKKLEKLSPIQNLLDSPVSSA